jgi:hypothetical protein
MAFSGATRRSPQAAKRQISEIPRITARSQARMRVHWPSSIVPMNCQAIPYVKKSATSSVPMAAAAAQLPVSARKARRTARVIPSERPRGRKISKGEIASWTFCAYRKTTGNAAARNGWTGTLEARPSQARKVICRAG